MKKTKLLVFMLFAFACGPGKGGSDGTSESGGSDSGSTGTSTADAPTTGPATGSGTGDDTTGGEPVVCVAATPGSPAVPECEIDFCGPASLHIVAHNEDGTPGLTCSMWNGVECGKLGYVAYGFRNEDLFVYLSFEPEVAEEHSDASFKANFDYFWANIYFRPDPTDHSEFYRQFDAMRGLEAFDSFAFEDGRIKASFTVNVETVWQYVDSDDPDCISGDISGQCACRYDGLEIPVTVDLDLTVDM